MFNGIIFNKGLITKIIKRPKGINIFVKSDLKLGLKDIGVSVACDGVCLTLISIKKRIMEFYLSNETIKRSKFRYIKLNDRINLELPLKYGPYLRGSSRLILSFNLMYLNFDLFIVCLLYTSPSPRDQ